MHDNGLPTLRALFAAGHGVHHFGGLRAVILDAAIFGLSRKALIEASGLAPTKMLVLRLGYAQGWRAAEPSTAPPMQMSPRARMAHLLALLGLAQVSGADDTLADWDQAIVLSQSCEADEHLLHCGTSEEGVCGCCGGLRERPYRRSIRSASRQRCLCSSSSLTALRLQHRWGQWSLERHHRGACQNAGDGRDPARGRERKRGSVRGEPRRVTRPTVRQRGRCVTGRSTLMPCAACGSRGRSVPCPAGPSSSAQAPWLARPANRCPHRNCRSCCP